MVLKVRTNWLCGNKFLVSYIATLNISVQVVFLFWDENELYCSFVAIACTSKFMFIFQSIAYIYLKLINVGTKTLDSTLQKSASAFL